MNLGEIRDLIKQFVLKKKKILVLLLFALLFAFLLMGIERTKFYGELKYYIDQKNEQLKRDEEWGHLEYSGDNVMEEIKSVMEVIEYDEEKFDENKTLEMLAEEELNLYTSFVGNGIFMNELGMFGDVSFLRMSIYSFENTSIGGVDLAMNVYDTTPEVVAVCEEMFKIILPTGYVELIEHLNDINYRGGEHKWDERKVEVQFRNEGITFLFYGKEQ